MEVHLISSKTFFHCRYIFVRKAAVTRKIEYNTHSSNYALQAVVKIRRDDSVHASDNSDISCATALLYVLSGY